MVLLSRTCPGTSKSAVEPSGALRNSEAGECHSRIGYDTFPRVPCSPGQKRLQAVHVRASRHASASSLTLEAQKEKSMKSYNTRDGRSYASGVMALIAMIVVMLSASIPARALPPGGGGGGGGGGSTECLGDSTASLWASPTEVRVGEYTTLHWAVHPAPGCSAMTQSITNIGPVARSGSMVVQILTPRSWILSGQKSGGRRDL
jgi:hypothetical protein